MHADTRVESLNADNDRTAEAPEAPVAEWETPDFTERSACAEICAYVFAT